MSKRTRPDKVKRLQAELPMMGAGMVLLHAEHIADLIAKRDARLPRDAYLNAIAESAGALVVEARALQRTAALLTDYDAAHRMLREEEAR